MRWAPIHPRQMLMLGLLTLAFLLALMLAAAPDLGTLDFSIGTESSTSSAPAAPAESPDRPTWVEDPLAPPLTSLRG